MYNCVCLSVVCVCVVCVFKDFQMDPLLKTGKICRNLNASRFLADVCQAIASCTERGRNEVAAHGASILRKSRSISI